MQEYIARFGHGQRQAGTAGAEQGEDAGEDGAPACAHSLPMSGPCLHLSGHRMGMSFGLGQLGLHCIATPVSSRPSAPKRVS